MNVLKRLYYNGSGLLPLNLLYKTSAISSLFPYHHIVSDQEVEHIIHLYPYKNTKQFKTDLDFFLKHFEPIHPDDLVKYINHHNKLPSKKFLLSFDDGFREIFEVVAPILKSKGLPAVFFINPAFIDNKKMFYRNKISVLLGRLKQRAGENILLEKVSQVLEIPTGGIKEIKMALLEIRQADQNKLDKLSEVLNINFNEYLQMHKPWMTGFELQELSNQGFTIGAHSWDHPYYQSIALEDQIKQTLDSCNYVKQFSGKNVLFSFPHSDAGLSQLLFDKILEPAHGIDLLFGVQNQKAEPANKMIHRFNCERPGIDITKQVKGMLIYSRIQKIINKQNIKRNYA